jgi:hypothetical protein
MTELDHRAPLAPAIVIRLEELIDQKLRQCAAEDGVSLAEFVRTVIDWWLREVEPPF